MIKNKNELMECIEADCLANYRTSTKCKLYGDKIWKFIICLRKLEYYTNVRSIVHFLFRFWFKYKYNKYSMLLGYSIPINVFEKGVGIPHRGTIVINSTAKIGMNCRIHQGVTIGSTSGSTASATIGDNVFIGANVSIIGDVHIADNVAIGANSVVVKDINEPGTTWGGCPARKISDKNSFAQLPPKLVEGIISMERSVDSIDKGKTGGRRDSM